MNDPKILPYFKRWIDSTDFVFPKEIKENIVIKIYKLSIDYENEQKNLKTNIKNKYKIEKSMLKKLENALQNNRDEIIQHAKKCTEFYGICLYIYIHIYYIV